MKYKKIAIVYDWFDKWGGVERVLLVFKEIFPRADFYTSYYDEKKAFWAKGIHIKTSFIQKLPDFIKKNRILSLPFYPFAFESFNFNNYDLVISITSSFAKGIITQPKTKHICYILTPTRFLWSHEKDYKFKIQSSKFINIYKNYLKKWDLISSMRPDKIISISKTVNERCKKYYNLDSEIVYPPFDIKYWQKIESKIKNLKFEKSFISKIPNSEFFLVVSRLEPYKKVDLVIKVFNKIKQNLIIVGKGTLENKLKKISNRNILFLSNLSDYQLGFLYSKAQALIISQEEDFGYVSLEAQFFRCPVIAYKKGGAIETVVDNKNGIFFNNQTEESLLKSIERFNKIKYNLINNIKKFNFININKFSKKKFINNFLRKI